MLLNQRPFTKLPVPGQKPSAPTTTVKASSLELAQMKLKQGASVCQATIKPSRPKPTGVSQWKSLPINAAAQPSMERPRLKFKHFTQRNQTSVAPQPSRPIPASRPAVEHPLNATSKPPRANLDVGSQQVAQKNAPSILGETAKTANPELRKRDSQNRGRLTARFSTELQEALGSGFQNQNSTFSLPDFVPSHGAAFYQATGCNCVASFLGFAGSPE